MALRKQRAWKMTLAVCRKYFTAIISHPKCFLSHLWNTDSKQMAWSSVKDIQAKKTSRKAYFQELLLHLTEKLFEIWNIPKHFSWTMQTFMKGILCASRWMRNGFCFLRSLGLVETKAILPCQSAVKTKTKSQWVAYH